MKIKASKESDIFRQHVNDETEKGGTVHPGQS